MNKKYATIAFIVTSQIGFLLMLKFYFLEVFYENAQSAETEADKK